MFFKTNLIEFHSNRAFTFVADRVRWRLPFHNILDWKTWSVCSSICLNLGGDFDTLVSRKKQAMGTEWLLAKILVIFQPTLSSAVKLSSCQSSCQAGKKQTDHLSSCQKRRIWKPTFSSTVKLVSDKCGQKISPQYCERETCTSMFCVSCNYFAWFETKQLTNHVAWN